MNIKKPKQLREFKERPNQHMTHFEDLILLGVEGIEELNDKVDRFLDQFNGEIKINQTLKIDGQPQVICWSKFEDYPDNSICLKSFLTSNKNCLSSVEEIYQKYGDRPDMAQKLEYCLDLQKCIPAGEQWQGDCLFTHRDLKEIEIGGKKYLTFHPNKIVYAFSEDNSTYNEVAVAGFGICFHTIYKGNLEHKTQSFNANQERLTNVPSDIYVMSPSIGQTKAENFDLKQITDGYQRLRELEKKLADNPNYEQITSNTQFMGYWNKFENNQFADNKKSQISPNSVLEDLREYIGQQLESVYNKKISGLKTQKGLDNAKYIYERDLEEANTILETNRGVIIDLVNCLNKQSEIKMLMWSGYKQSKPDYSTFFLHQDDGYIPADMEGIALSDQDGNVVKLVDRTAFSNVNRDKKYLSGFQHESLDIDEEKQQFLEEYGE